MFNPVNECQNYGLFSARTNLDPWDQYSDSQIWEALEKTHIKEMVSGRMIEQCHIMPNDALLE